MKSKRFATSRALVVLGTLLASGSAFAQAEDDASPAVIEGSAEDGVAPEAMGEEDHLETDRDSFTPSTSLVGRGRTMLEGSYSFIDNRDAKNSQSFPELLGRVGLTRWLELRLGWNYEVGGGGSVSGSEIGGEEEDSKSETRVIYGLKLAVSEQRRWVPRAAVILHAATPTSGPGTATEYVAAIVGGWTLPNQWSLDTSLRYVAASEEGDRYHQWAPSVVLKIPLGSRWNVHAEYFGIVSDDRAGDIAPQYLSPGVHFMISPDWEIGTRVGFGLNDDAASFFSNVGIAFRF